jgi:hypothetical protein
MDARCSFRSGYRFNNVAPGEYFVLLHARGGEGSKFSLSDEAGRNMRLGGFRGEAVLLMQPVTEPNLSKLVKADFEHE